MPGKTVVTGVIGQDAHVVGNWILKLAFEQAGFKVVGLGPMVSQEEFVRAAVETNASAILMSSIYGHGLIDCRGFREKCEEAGLKGVRLYIGGMLVVGKQEWRDVEKEFKRLGFDRVYPPGTTPMTAIADLKKDLGLESLAPAPSPKRSRLAASRTSAGPRAVEVRNRKWSEAELFEKRKEVLGWWPTGREIEDLSESIAYWKRMPEDKIYANKLEKAQREGRTLLRMGLGHATVEETIAHARAVEEAGADLVYIYQDTYTRKRRFEQAQKGIEESLKTGRSVINGYPLVNYGVKNARHIIESIKSPIRFEGCSDEEPMLAREMGMAAGWSCDSAIDFRQLVAHSRNYPLDRMIRNAQYNNRLAAYFTERGAPFLVNVTASVHGFCPQGINIAIAVLQSMLVAEQGVKHITLNPAQHFNIIHDIATIRAVQELVKEYLHRHGFDDVAITTHFSPWQGNWPKDERQASAMVAMNAAIGLLAGADCAYVRSLHEGVGIPDTESSVTAARIARQVMRTLDGQQFTETPELKIEKEMLKLEARAIVDRTIELGGGDAAVGEVKAAEAGVLDVPFPSWIGAAGRVVAVRDSRGILRYLDTGNVPIPREVMKYHRQQIRQRERAEGIKADLNMVVSDVCRLSAPA
ncbi:MAG: methylaspartate mutase subunit S [Chloroflexi bacterium]|nr:methylaspartate mutase subunit S [Chloroflexota bacterium]